MGEFNGIGEEQSTAVYTRALRERVIELADRLTQLEGQNAALKQWIYENGHAAGWLEEVNGAPLASTELSAALAEFVKEFI